MQEEKGELIMCKDGKEQKKTTEKTETTPKNVIPEGTKDEGVDESKPGTPPATHPATPKVSESNAASEPGDSTPVPTPPTPTSSPTTPKTSKRETSKKRRPRKKRAKTVLQAGKKILHSQWFVIFAIIAAVAIIAVGAVGGLDYYQKKMSEKYQKMKEDKFVELSKLLSVPVEAFSEESMKGFALRSAGYELESSVPEKGYASPLSVVQRLSRFETLAVEAGLSKEAIRKAIQAKCFLVCCKYQMIGREKDIEAIKDFAKGYGEDESAEDEPVSGPVFDSSFIADSHSSN